MRRLRYNLTMRRANQSKRRGQPDWVKQAVLYDHGLTPNNPVWVSGKGEASEIGPLHVHVHKGIDLGICISNGYELVFGDFTMIPEPGDIWLGGMWEPHAWRILKSGAEIVLVCFLPEFIDDGLEPNLNLLRIFTVPASKRPRVTTPEMRRRTQEIGIRLGDESDQQKPGWRTIVRLLVMDLLIMLQRNWRPPHGARGGSAIRADDLARIIPALALVHAQPALRIPPKAAADACRMSASSFHQTFARTMGISFGQFEIRSRLALAARALLDTDLPVTAIAEQTGFVHASHLHRHFVKHHGLTPADYRRRAFAPSSASKPSRANHPASSNNT